MQKPSLTSQHGVFSRSSGGTWIPLKRSNTGISCWRPMERWSQEVRTQARLVDGGGRNAKHFLCALRDSALLEVLWVKTVVIDAFGNGVSWR